jgi:molybdopterin-guanine dinucleotide biosynthesis protein A
MSIGLVLAGGGSRRMGCDKAALVVHGATLLQRAIRTVRDAGFTPIVLTPPRPAALLLGARAIDETGGGPPGGPLPALACGLREAATVGAPGTRPSGAGAVVALACDLPLVPASLLRALVDLPGTWDAAVPRAGGVLQVLAAAYRPACLPAIETALAAGDRSIHHWLGAVRLRVLEEEALDPHGGAAIFANVNTPEDRMRVEAALAGGAADARPAPAADRS